MNFTFNLSVFPRRKCHRQRLEFVYYLYSLLSSLLAAVSRSLFTNAHSACREVVRDMIRAAPRHKEVPTVLHVTWPAVGLPMGSIKIFHLRIHLVVLSCMMKTSWLHCKQGFRRTETLHTNLGIKCW